MSPPYHKDYLGVAERLNRSILDLARANIFHAGLPIWLWPDAIMAAVYVHNRLPTKGGIESITPYEGLNKVKPRIGHLRPWGCQVMVSTEVGKHKHHKLMKRSEKCIFIGYEDNAWRCLSLENNWKELVSASCIFHENKFPGLRKCAPAVMEDLLPHQEKKKTKKKSHPSPPSYNCTGPHSRG